MWYDKLRAGLEARGFTACKVDPCLFISKKDDGDEYNWEMTEGGTVEEFFGIQVDPTNDGGFKLIQT
eukprot:14928147-Ditylum_brightwellii.AAC.1